jgi:hypothetical protein
MVKATLVTSILGLLLLTGWSVHRYAESPSTALAKQSSPVVVELFTSEGCSSCPPADKLLEQLDRDGMIDGVPVIALSEHVDYWDGLGWRDRFSSRTFTDRQRDYSHTLRIDSPYTPQMVVNGRFEFVGNDGESLRRAVHQAAESTKAADVSLTWASPAEIHVSVSNVSKPDALIYLAITESGLSTVVDAGENGGRTLRHAGVVRLFRQVGATKTGGVSISAPVNLSPTWNKARLKAVVLVQDGANGPVIGAASRSLQ